VSELQHPEPGAPSRAKRFGNAFHLIGRFSMVAGIVIPACLALFVFHLYRNGDMERSLFSDCLWACAAVPFLVAVFVYLPCTLVDHMLTGR
jgi:hypothetical protein